MREDDAKKIYFDGWADGRGIEQGGYHGSGDEKEYEGREEDWINSFSKITNKDSVEAIEVTIYDSLARMNRTFAVGKLSRELEAALLKAEMWQSTAESRENQIREYQDRLAANKYKVTTDISQELLDGIAP